MNIKRMYLTCYISSMYSNIINTIAWVPSVFKYKHYAPLKNLQFGESLRKRSLILRVVVRGGIFDPCNSHLILLPQYVLFKKDE